MRKRCFWVVVCRGMCARSATPDPLLCTLWARNCVFGSLGCVSLNCATPTAPLEGIPLTSQSHAPGPTHWWQDGVHTTASDKDTLWCPGTSNGATHHNPDRPPCNLWLHGDGMSPQALPKARCKASRLPSYAPPGSTSYQLSVLEGLLTQKIPRTSQKNEIKHQITISS